ncbi:MAG: glycosyltransferase family 2 protein [Acidobacteria bacterium]|nr:glycosyltransferase family 2 protein [Acidobacteriota bacterium]
MTNDPLIAIVILTYRSEAIIERCLESFAQLRYPNASFLIVDNDSRDATADIVLTRFPQISFIPAGGNGGYTGGNNLGIEQAIKQGAKYVLIVNPDTVLQNPDFLTEMVGYCETQPRLGIAGPRVFLRAIDTIQNTILFPPGLGRNVVHWFRYRWNSQFAQLSGAAVASAEMLNGVCVLFRTECLQQIGLFDEPIFMYIEDADLAYRARLAHWEIRYLPIDSVIHEQKEEGYHETGFAAWLLKRNSVYYLLKIGRRAEAWGYASCSLALFFVKLCLSARRRGFQAYGVFLLKMIKSYTALFCGQTIGQRWSER